MNFWATKLFFFPFLLSSRIVIKRRHTSPAFKIWYFSRSVAKINVVQVFYQVSTSIQLLVSLFCAGNQMHIPSINSKSIHKKDCPLPVLMGVGNPARTWSIPAELLFHSCCPSKCRFGACPDAGVGWRCRFDLENLPHRISSHPLAGITKYFSQEAIDSLNTHTWDEGCSGTFSRRRFHQPTEFQHFHPD